MLEFIEKPGVLLLGVPLLLLIVAVVVVVIRWASNPASTPHSVAMPAAAPAFAPGWYPDPHGQVRLRYFDGTAWTPHTQV